MFQAVILFVVSASRVKYRFICKHFFHLTQILKIYSVNIFPVILIERPQNGISIQRKMSINSLTFTCINNDVYLRFWLLTLTMCGIYEPLKNINNMIEVPSVLKSVSFIVKEGNNLLCAVLFWAFWNCLKEMISSK